MRLAAFIMLGPLLALAPLTAPSGAGAEGVALHIQGRAPVGKIPPKTARGEKDTVYVVGEGTGETEFLAADEISNAVTSGQESGPNGELALRVLAVPGHGGLQNIRDVLTRPNVDFGIAPVPVLDAAAATDGMANLRERIAYVAPLYVEEVHLLAGQGVAKVEDVAGKTVSVGEAGSSTELLAREVLTGLGIKVVESNLAGLAAVEGVRDDKIAAAFVVSGKPVGFLRGLDGKGLKFLPLPVEKIPGGFLPSLIGHADYPGLVPEGARVETYGVQNVLFGYNWPLRSARGQAGRTFLSILLYRLPDLQVGDRHPKWREVNVAATLPGWRRLPAMQAWLDRAKPRTAGPAQEAEFESFLRRTNTRVTGENRDALYQDFLRWQRGPGTGPQR
jgi:uncharacterized protein